MRWAGEAYLGMRPGASVCSVCRPCWICMRACIARGLVITERASGFCICIPAEHTVGKTRKHFSETQKTQESNTLRKTTYLTKKKNIYTKKYNSLSKQNAQWRKTRASLCTFCFFQQKSVCVLYKIVFSGFFGVDIHLLMKISLNYCIFKTLTKIRPL